MRAPCAAAALPWGMRSRLADACGGLGSVLNPPHAGWQQRVGPDRIDVTAEKAYAMERIVNVRVEKLPEGVFLATSDEVQGLVAQGRTITETLEIARDVARRLLEAQAEREAVAAPPIAADAFDYPLVVSD